MIDSIKCSKCGSSNIIQYPNSNIHYCGNCDTNIEIIYEFCYNPSTYESCGATVSIHKTRKGAEMAMEFHKAEALKEYEQYDFNEAEKTAMPFGDGESWYIRETKLED